MDQLRFVSLMAPSAGDLWRDVAASVGARMIDDVPWQERERMLVRGEAEIGVVCGLQYVLRSGLELLAAPVMRGARYADQPVYFSDVVVRRDSPFASLTDLRGLTWAVNEPTSQSGFNITRYVLAARGETSAFFGRVVESGAHERSLELLLDRTVDGTAIDSTVLEALLRRRPWLDAEIRVVETLGPSPIPPLVTASTVPPAVREPLRAALLALPARDDVVRFTAVRDIDYDPIREMARVAQQLPAWAFEEPVYI